MSRNFPLSILISIFIAFIYCNISFAQDSTKNSAASTEEIINYTTQNYGVDDRLINGSLFQNTNIIKKGHPNFFTNDWVFGPLYIKGIKYTDARVKYNIEKDKIILLTKLSNGNTIQISVNDNLIDSLYIRDRLVLNSNLIPFDLKGYYEPIYIGTHVKAYKKHSVRFRITKIPYKSQVSSETILMGYYDEPTSTIHLHIDDEFIDITKKAIFISLFKEQKKSINKFLKTNLIDYKKADNDQLNNLFKYCDEILFNKNSTN